MLTDPRFAPWRDEAVRRGYASSVVLPLIADDKTLGAISIYSKVPDSFSDEEATLLGQLADDLAYGIGAIRFRLAHARAEAALRESEERHQLATSVANEAIWEVNLAAGTTRWNQAYAELFGCPPEATAHGPWWLERVHPEDRDAVESSFREALADGADSWFREYRMKLIDESYAFLHDRAIIVRDSAGRPVRAVGAKLNVTDRKKWETTLERSVRRFSLLAESAETLLQTDQPQQVVDELCRKVMEHLDCHVFFNFLVDESAGRLHLNACAGIPPGDACRIEWLEYGAAICGCAARDGQRIVAECIPTTFDPRTELVKSYGVTAYACHPLFGAGGKVLGTLSFGTRSRETFTEADLSLMKAITDQVAVAMIRLQSRDDLQRTAEDLTRSNRDLEQFAYVASHDLQEPLRMVSGFVQLLQKKYGSRLDAEADQYIEYAVQGAKQMQTLINDLLTYSRVGTRGRDLVPTDTDATLRQVLERFRPSIAETAAEITHGQLPTVRADGTQLVHVFQNLIGNAIKFCGGEPPKIHVDASLQGDAWLFSVRDNGIGIEAEFQERIFLIFQRLHTRQQYPGTGIGLAICKKIVDRHGGRIWVESQAGEGSVFYFTIPI